MIIKFIKAILRELSSPQEDGLFIQASSTEFDLAETFHQKRYLHDEVRQPIDAGLSLDPTLPPDTEIPACPDLLRTNAAQQDQSVNPQTL